MDEKLEPYEDYFKNVVKPKVLKGEENTLGSKWKRLVPTAYREIIADKDKKIERLNDIINTLEEELEENLNYEEYDRVEKDTFIKVIKRIEELKESK